ncbi:MAG: bacteriohemerythrin [Rhodospirillum sp.]|nr:bacteriohemerythrin [Rhodospirillum sp.]MCF8488517.1 bacteriohemerythrin [Rhodospirillum sp.]MCF8499262.1 bacteriohemerythrin [Rhodospirillum sp.]
MSLIKWSEKMSVGNAALDRDHQTLLNILNQFHGVMRGRVEREALSGLFEELAHYTEYHFEMEERLMRMCAYAELEDHKALHDGLKRRVAVFKDRHAADPENFPLLEMFDFLSDWMMRHILREDMKISKALQAAKRKKK